MPQAVAERLRDEFGLGGHLIAVNTFDLVTLEEHRQAVFLHGRAAATQGEDVVPAVFVKDAGQQ